MKTQTTKARTSGVALGRCHEKLSLTVQTMCTSPQSLRKRLGNAVLCHFGVLIENFFPEEFREQFREIHNSVTKIPDTREEGLYMAAIHNMKAKEVTCIIDKILVLREDVARAYYKRSFNR
jgi:hypothetical protein